MDRDTVETGRVIRNKDARGRRKTLVAEIKKKKKRCARARARGEKDADLFAEYVYVKGEPGWKKKDGTNRKLLNEFRAPPRRLFTLLHELRCTHARTRPRTDTR